MGVVVFVFVRNRVAKWTCNHSPYCQKCSLSPMEKFNVHFQYTYTYT